MKDMKYSTMRKIEVLDTGEYLGFTYYILNLGTHPTAYIDIPKTHKLYKKSYTDIEENLDAHGGLTYSNNKLYLSKEEFVEGWFIGWDYAHCDDYTGYEALLNSEFQSHGKKWSTQEIKDEVFKVCKELSKIYLISNFKGDIKWNFGKKYKINKNI